MAMNLFHKSSASILFCIRASPCNLNPLKTFTLSQHRCGSHVHANNPFVKVSEEVREAVESRKPVVALETTIYTHGFPYPDNIALASHLESVVRVNGGIPATIGVLNGVARIGLQADELIKLAASAGKSETRKISRRDLASICGLGYAGRTQNGGTTVSGTMVLAQLAGIKVFATGGLGGVHRSGETTMDISADLTELGRTQMAVVSSGCKSFLDIPRTLEYLETQGVSVATFADNRDGQVNFPAFWTRDSGTVSPLTIRNEEEAAAMIYAQLGLSLSSGLLFANPIPAEHSIPKDQMDGIIAQALCDAQKSGSTGSDNTPFLLKRIREITNGSTVKANRALIEANVARGTKVAVHLAKLVKENHDCIHQDRVNTKSAAHVEENPKSIASISANMPAPSYQCMSSLTDIAEVIVAGSVAIDLSCDYNPQTKELGSSQPKLHTSNPALINQSLGGVGQNVARTLKYMSCSVRLCSVVANDVSGSTALELLSKEGLQTTGIQITATGYHTAQYVAINDNQKNLVLAMADMEILQNPHGNFDTLWRPHLDACKPKWLVVDANWNPDTLRRWLDAAKSSGIPVAYEPVSEAKAKRIFASQSQSDVSLAAVPNHSITLATPNALELTSMYRAARVAGTLDREDWWQVVDAFGLSSSGSRDKLVSLTNGDLVDQGIPQQSIQLLPFIPCILTTLGEDGVLLTRMLRPGDDLLTSPVSAPYILSRTTNGSDTVGGVYMRLFPPIEKVPGDEIINVNGVGDTFLGVLVAGLTRKKFNDIADLVNIAQRGSIMTLKSREAVSPQIPTLENAL